MLKKGYIFFLVVACGFILAERSRASFRYFDRGVDYWNEKPKNSRSDKKKTEPTEKKAFSWKEAMDPKNDEFFREGDHIPPRPFMELIRDPSDYNIEKWNEYIAKKNELSTRLLQRIREYMGSSQKVSPKFMAKTVAFAQRKLEKPKQPNRFQMRFYFSSDCPHCKRMFSTIKSLVKKGFYVEGRQVDEGKLPKLPFPITRATKAEREKKGIKTIPVLLIADMKSKRVFRLNGYQSLESVYHVMQIAN